MVFNAFLKIDGIAGESQGGAIELASFSWGVSNSISSTTGSGAGGGKASFQDFSFSARAGKQSPQLFGAAVEGQDIPRATLTVGNKLEPRAIRFGDGIISHYKLDQGAHFHDKCSHSGLAGGPFGAPLD